MPALETLGQYLEEARTLLQDKHEPYRYTTDELVEALNIGLAEARRLRADLFLPRGDVPYFAPTDTNRKVPLNIMYRSTLAYYIVGRAQLRDDENTTDQRAGALLQKFTAQMLQVGS